MILIDSNVLLDIFTIDPIWYRWSSDLLGEAANTSELVINPLIFAEVSIHFATVEDLDETFPPERFKRRPIPYAAAFLAGKAYVDYKRRGGLKTSPLPDFYIGAHAAVEGLKLLTRDAARYRTYFPTVELISP